MSGENLKKSFDVAVERRDLGSNVQGELSSHLVPCNPLLETRELRRIFRETGEELEILKGVNFSMNAGEFVALTGASGSGKSTFLNLIGLLDTPTSGEIFFRGENLQKLSAAQKDDYHRLHLGFVFQFHHLLSEFTAFENVCVPARIIGSSVAECRERAESLLETVGLKDRMKHLPRELSGGERQRVAVARALMNHPDIVLADEPSGNLDEKNAVMLNELFCELNQKFKQTILVVTHDARLAACATRNVTMHYGKILDGQGVV